MPRYVKPKPDVRSSMRDDKKSTSNVIASKQLAKTNETRQKIAQDKKPRPVSKPPVANGYLGYSPPPTGGGNTKKVKKPKPQKTGPATTTDPYDFPPILPDYSVPDPPPPPVRVPERDVVELLNQTVDAATIQNLLFENIGANELTKFVRHDTVEGINPYYNIISNLSDIKRKFDPSSLVSLQKTDSSLFDIYAINLDDKIPTEEYLENNNLLNYVYFDVEGNLVIEVVNMSDSELVEVEIDRNGTIYEVEEL